MGNVANGVLGSIKQNFSKSKGLIVHFFAPHCFPKYQYKKLRKLALRKTWLLSN